MDKKKNHKFSKLIIISVLIFMFLIPVPRAQSNSSSSIVMDITSGRVLYEKNSHEKKLIASTTKILTAIIVLENAELNEYVQIGQEVLKMYGTNIYIEVGEKIKIIDLLYGLLLRSGNDAAVALAIATSGSEEKFIEEMNKKAKEIGMKNSLFLNPHGLDEETKNYSTAYDMALLMQYAYKNEIYNTISQTQKYIATTDKKTYLWYNRNKLLSNYEYCTGGKNGYTPTAGKTLVSTAKKNNMEVLIVTLNDNQIYTTHENLYEKIFSEYKNYKIIDKDEFYLDKNFVSEEVYLKNDFYYPLKEEEIEKIKTIVSIPKNNFSKKGNIIIYLNEQEIGKLPIYVSEKEKREEKFFSKLKKLFIR